MSAFEDYVRSLDPALARAFHKGHFECWDQYDRATTPLGAPRWTKTGKGHALYPGGVSVAHGTEQQSTVYTVFVGAEDLTFNGGIRQRLIAKRDGGVTFGFFIRQDIVRLEVYDGTSVRYLAHDWRNAKSLAAVIEDGQKPKFYRDGAFLDLGNNVVAITPGTSAVSIGMFYTGVTTDELVNPMTFAVLATEELTAAQIAELHSLWYDYKARTRPERRVYSVAQIPPDAIEHWRAGSSLVGTVRGITLTRDVGITKDRGRVFQHRAELQDPARELALRVTDTRLDNPDAFSVSAVFSTRSAGGANFGRWFSKPSSAAQKFSYVDSAGRVTYRLDLTAGGQYTYRTVAAGVVRFSDIPQHLLVVDPIDGATPPSIFVDGEDLALTKVSGDLGDTPEDDTGELTIGLSGAVANRAWDGSVEDFVWFGKALSTAEIRAEYVRCANVHTALWNRYQEPITLANVGSGGRVGPFEVLGGTHGWVDNGTHRGLRCATTGALWMPSKMAYGAWYLRFYKGTDGVVSEVMLCATEKGGRTASGQQGYAFRVFSDGQIRLLKAAGTNILYGTIGEVAAGNEYEIFITRSSATHTWRVWARGGGYASWEDIGSVVDNTVQSSGYFCPEMEASDVLYDVRMYPIGGTLLPWEVLP